MSAHFAVFLFILTVATGLLWLADLAIFRRVRRASAESTLRRFALQNGAPLAPDERRALRERLIRAPGWIELPAGLFPVLLAVFLVRSFVLEPFRIPSGSMIPTLRVGDLIVVDKFSYGLRLPIVDTTLIGTGSPERGDVVVFRYPVDPSENYVKRVVGLPGDTIVYRDQQLSINGRPVPTAQTTDPLDSDTGSTAHRFTESLPTAAGAVAHPILVDARRATRMGPIARFPFIDQCAWSADHTGVRCTVPPGQYFMLGDNRDNSADSRYWGFVPAANLVGKAVFVWMNLGDWTRIRPIR